MQKNGAGLHTASSCFWDNTTDGSCTVRWENKTMYCIVSVFGLSIQNIQNVFQKKKRRSFQIQTTTKKSTSFIYKSLNNTGKKPFKKNYVLFIINIIIIILYIDIYLFLKINKTKKIKLIM